MRVTALVALVVLGCGDNGPAAGPATVIDQLPPAFSMQSQVVVKFHSKGRSKSFSCVLDGTETPVCTTPWMFDVDEGPHQIEVRAVGEDNAIGEPATGSFTVDTTPPTVMIVTGPSGLTNVTRPTWTFVTGGNPAMVQCELDGGPVVPCMDSYTVTDDLSEDVHTFVVQAVDAAGNDATDGVQIVVDTTGPLINVYLAPPPRTNNPTPAINFSVVDPHGATAACSVDSDPAVGCDGSTGFSAPAPLAEGPHAYHISALDFAGNTSTAEVDFFVDLTPPTVTITGGPTSPTTDASPSFTFTTSADTTRTVCDMDTGEHVDPCASGVMFANLMPGNRTFTVTAYDDAVPANIATATYPFELAAM